MVLRYHLLSIIENKMSVNVLSNSSDTCGTFLE